MAFSKLAALWILFSLFYNEATFADVSILGETDHTFGSPASNLEHDHLKSKIHRLESQMEEKSRELEIKDASMAHKDKVIQEQSDSVAYLQSEVSFLQKKKNMDVADQVELAHARAAELGIQVEELKKELEQQENDKEMLVVLESENEKNIKELSSKLDNLQKINDEQRKTMHKIERALRIAEEETAKSNLEATTKNRELTEVHGAWLPPWLAAYVIRLQTFLNTHWSIHGKPPMDLAIQMVCEKGDQAHKWAQPHMETVKNKWIPATKERLLLMKARAEPHIYSLTTKILEVHEASKALITRYIIRIQEHVDPFFQEAKKISKPYIDQIATATRPQVEKVRTYLNPYAEKVLRAYWKFLESAPTYHRQVQVNVQEILKRQEFTRPLATEEFSWIAVSSLLALPIVILFRIGSGILCKKVKKPLPAHSHHMAKQEHLDN